MSDDVQVRARIDILGVVPAIIQKDLEILLGGCHLSMICAVTDHTYMTRFPRPYLHMISDQRLEAVN